MFDLHRSRLGQLKGEPGMPSEFEVTGLAAVLELGHTVVDPGAPAAELMMVG